MLQDHVCHMLLEQCAFQIRSWSTFDLEYSSRLLYGPGPSNIWSWNIRSRSIWSWTRSRGQNLKKSFQNKNIGLLQDRTTTRLATFSKLSTSLKIPFVQSQFLTQRPLFVTFNSTDAPCFENWGRTPASNSW